MMSVEKVSDRRDLVRFESEWTYLVSGIKEASLFDTYEWVTTWLDAFWPEKPVSFLFVRNTGKLIGILPLLDDAQGESWCPMSLVSPMNWHSYRSNIICGENPAIVCETLVTYLQNERRGFRLAFPRTLAHAPVAESLPEVARRHGLSVLLLKGAPSPIIRFTHDWDSYLKTRSHHLAREVKRKVARCEKAGVVERRVVDREELCAQAMQDILLIDSESWKETAGSSLNAQPEITRFYTDFAHKAANNGWLCLHILYLDSKPIAYVYGAIFKKQYFALKTSYDSTYRTLSPGIVLFDHVFRHAIDQGVEVFEFLGESSRWKNEFANDVREQLNVCTFEMLSLRCQSCRLYLQHLKPFLKRRIPLVVRLKHLLEPYNAPSHENSTHTLEQS